MLVLLYKRSSAHLYSQIVRCEFFLVVAALCPPPQMVPVRRWVPDSVSWARLEEAGQIPLADLLETLRPRASAGSGSDRLAGPEGGVVAAVGRNERNPDDALGEGAGEYYGEVIGGEHPGRGDGATKCQGRGSDVRGSDVRGVTDEGKEDAARGEGGGGGGGSLRGRGSEGEPLYLHDWSLPQNLGQDSSLLVGRFQVSHPTVGIGGTFFARSSPDFWEEAVEIRPLEIGGQLTPFSPLRCKHVLLEAVLTRTACWFDSSNK